MRCEEIREWLSEHIDGVLDADREDQLTQHLAECEECRTELSALKEAVTALNSAEELAPPADLLDRIHAQIEKEDAPVPRRTIWFILNTPFARVAMAAGLLVMVGYYGMRGAAPASKDAVEAEAMLSATLPEEVGAMPEERIESLETDDASGHMELEEPMEMMSLMDSIAPAAAPVPSRMMAAPAKPHRTVEEMYAEDVTLLVDTEGIENEAAEKKEASLRYARGKAVPPAGKKVVARRAASNKKDAEPEKAPSAEKSDIGWASTEDSMFTPIAVPEPEPKPALKLKSTTERVAGLLGADVQTSAISIAAQDRDEVTASLRKVAVLYETLGYDIVDTPARDRHAEAASGAIIVRVRVRTEDYEDLLTTLKEHGTVEASRPRVDAGADKDQAAVFLDLIVTITAE